MGGDGRRLLRVSRRLNGTKTGSGSLYVLTALLAKREAIAVDESGEVWEVPLMELRASPVQNQSAKPKLAEHGPSLRKSSRAGGAATNNHIAITQQRDNAV